MRTRATVALLAVTLLAGCAVSKTELAARAQLDRARAAYREAQADPLVQSYAQLRLADAQRAVQAAEQADHARDKLHLSYIAEKRAQIASITGATAKTEQDTLQLGRETTEALLKQRERELQAARADLAAREREAEQSRTASATRGRAPDATAREAEQARAVEQARVQAEQARAQVEQARAQAEQARRQAEAEAKARAAEEAKAAALSKELSELKGQQTDRGLVLNLGDVLFAAGKAEIAPGGHRSIDQLAEFLKRYPRRRVLIEGHSDNIGAEDFNIKLSQQRAESVRNLLVSKGVAADRITARGYGPKYPIVENDSPVGRQQNRRVEVLVLTEGASPERSAR